MEKLMKITLNLLKEKIKDNISQIRENQKTIKELHSKQCSESTKDRLEKEYSKNKALLAENIDFIYLQLKLTEALEKDNAPDSLLKDINDFFELTMNGYMLYSSDHNDSEDKFNEELEDFHHQLTDYGETGSLSTKLCKSK
jgi:hypothetical protein